MAFSVLSPWTDYMTGTPDRRDSCTGTGAAATSYCTASIRTKHKYILPFLKMGH